MWDWIRATFVTPDESDGWCYESHWAWDVLLAVLGIIAVMILLAAAD